MLISSEQLSEEENLKYAIYDCHNRKLPRVQSFNTETCEVTFALYLKGAEGHIEDLRILTPAHTQQYVTVTLPGAFATYNGERVTESSFHVENLELERQKSKGVVETAKEQLENTLDRWKPDEIIGLNQISKEQFLEFCETKLKHIDNE